MRFGWVLGVLFLVGCASPVADLISLKVRARLESEVGRSLTIKVAAEGPQGMSLTGAHVLIVTPSGQVQTSDFDPEIGSFRSVIAQPESGIYEIEVRSILVAQPHKLKVEHQVLTQAPEIVELKDAIAQNALAGQSLTFGQPVLFSTQKVPGATVYACELFMGQNKIYSATTTDGHFLVPASSVPLSDDLSVRVQAQSQFGDPFLVNQEFLSVSYAKGSSVHFKVR